MRHLIAAAGGLTLLSMLGGVFIGIQLSARGAAPEFAILDPDEPGSRALIDEIGSLSGRMNQLETQAQRLTQRMGKPSRVAAAAPDAAMDSHASAGGPLLDAPFGDASHVGPSLLRLSLGLDEIEANLDGVASMVARRDLDGMAFPSRPPIPGIAISSGFGTRLDPFTKRPARHAGVDYTAPWGTKILASAGGRVRRAGPYGAFGRTVEVDHGDGLVTRYAHVSRTLVKVGDFVLPGQAIAQVGSTGRSTGAHLHFEVLRDGKPVHPELYLAGDES
jgi:murein DD-endopeptidase MepM/ murein hydrolase activator NlpD